jgi:hypothetical protein
MGSDAGSLEMMMQKIIKKTIKALKRLELMWLRATKYMVVVRCEGVIAKTHFADNWEDALEWAACYPQADTVIAIGKHRKVLAARY